MDEQEIESRIKERGREFYARIQGDAPVIFHKGWWMGRLLDRCMRNEEFKVRLFRFVDVFPLLENSDSLGRHIEEYFGDYIRVFPSLLKWGMRGSGLAGAAAKRILVQAMRMSIQSMARQFIIGENSREALKNLRKLRRGRFAFSLDILGEASTSERESEIYLQRYLDLLNDLTEEARTWEGLGNQRSNLDWGYSPKVQVSIKPSSLYSQVNPMDFEGSVQAICKRLEPILIQARQLGVFVHLDMEQYRTKAITLEVYRRSLSSLEIERPLLGVVLQSYLSDTEEDLTALLRWSRDRDLPLSIRLVKGAYWDYETILAAQQGWKSPVFSKKTETDAAFETLSRKILENQDICYLACGSHNIRSISAVLEIASSLHVPENRYEFQTLYGMAEPVRRGLLTQGLRVRVYCPFGELLPGMAYLVRRLLENTSNESFLRRSFVEKIDVEKLLENPASNMAIATPQVNPDSAKADFTNEAQVDFTKADVRAAFAQALADARRRLGSIYPLLIGSEEVRSEEKLDSLNPARPSEVIGRVCQSGPTEINAAVAAAKEAFKTWRDMPPERRAEFLFRAADLARDRIYGLAAWQVLEVGKQWDQAYSDVTEAIDFLRYYGREMIRLARPKKMGAVPGEVNRYLYEPRGLAAVIAPWNFPLAISCGMCAAAMVTGNCVLYKPSGLSSIVGFTLAELFLDAGIPRGVFNYVPGRSNVIGDYLVDHPEIAVVAFTGSLQAGLRIIERASRVHEGQAQIKRVIAEMGGKNAIIIDDDADLDEAVTHVIQSAFGFQGQKCSACSRLIVLESIYQRLIGRLVEAAKSVRIGPAEDPANFMGPVVEKAAQEKILQYIEIGRKEGKVLLCREVPEDGYYAPLTIFGDVGSEHRVAQEEIFGPVLSVMRARSFDHAIEIANSTKYALTGGVFSRSPKHLEQATRQFRVGNLYLNRGITGALVGRQPFGGFNLSGVGSKTGGPDYLLQFMNPRCITENTMRRGFAPAGENAAET